MPILADNSFDPTDNIKFGFSYGISTGSVGFSFIRYNPAYSLAINSCGRILIEGKQY